MNVMDFQRAGTVVAAIVDLIVGWIGIGWAQVTTSKEFFRSSMLESSRLRRWMMTSGTMGVVVLGLSGNAHAVSPVKGDPAGFVATVGQEVVQILATKDLEADQRSRRIRDIIVRALDLDTMARRVLGRHWRVTSNAERDRYITLFRNYFANLYAIQLSGHASEAFTVVRHQPLRQNENLVVARITRRNGRPIAMGFRVRQMNDRLRIVDMTFAGVSLVVTKRAEFDSIIRREGLRSLLRRLDAQQAIMLPQRNQLVSFIAEAMSVMKNGINTHFAR